MDKLVAAAVISSLILSVSSVGAETVRGAATLTDVSGSVLVDGAPYKGRPLKAGDVVTTFGDGRATLDYADGCVIVVAANSPATINAASPCTLGGAPGSVGGAPGIGGAAPGIGGGAAGVGGAAAVGISGTFVALGGAAAAAGVVFAATRSKPASP